MPDEIVLLPARNRHAATRRPAATRPADEVEDFSSTPPLPPVARSKQATVLLSCFLAIFLTIGYNQSYGVFQEYYLSPSQTLLRPAPTSMEPPPTAQLAFVGTLGAGLTWAGSIFVNPLISRIEYLSGIPAGLTTSAGSNRRRQLQMHHRLLRTLTPRYITLAGVLLMSVGFLLASYSYTVTQLLLTQGLLYGVGSSMLYFPLLGPAPEFFTVHRATALGLILSGGGAGGLVLSPALRTLLSLVGGSWTLRILSGIYLIVGAPIAWNVPASRFPAVVRSVSSPPPGSGESEARHTTVETALPSSREAVSLLPRRRTHIPASLAITPIFLLSAVGAFCQSAGAQLPMTFVPSYSVALGLSAARGATLLAVASGVNAVARVASGYAGDRLGRLNALVVSLLVAFAAVLGLWLGSVSVFAPDTASPVAGDGEGSAGLGSSGSAAATRLWLAFVVLYNVAAGGYYALFPATIADVFGIRSYAAVNGFIYFVRGCGTMVGSPVGGTLLGRGSSQAVKGYADVVVWDAALLLGSSLCILGVRWADALRRGWKWIA